MQSGRIAFRRNQLGHLIRSTFEQKTNFFSEQDCIDVSDVPGRVQFFYQSRKKSGVQEKKTYVKCGLEVYVHEMWIGDLNVAPSLRSKGIGRQLVKACEEIARAIDIYRLNVYPLNRSQPFWRKMGFLPHSITNRVMVKKIGPKL